jgi:hypothetical protein
VPTLLVFSVYLRLTEIDPLLVLVVKRVEAIRTATKEVRRLFVERQVRDVLTTRNGLDTEVTLNLPL